LAEKLEDEKTSEEVENPCSYEPLICRNKPPSFPMQTKPVLFSNVPWIYCTTISRVSYSKKIQCGV